MGILIWRIQETLSQETLARGEESCLLGLLGAARWRKWEVVCRSEGGWVNTDVSGVSHSSGKLGIWVGGAKRSCQTQGVLRVSVRVESKEAWRQGRLGRAWEAWKRGL